MVFPLIFKTSQCENHFDTNLIKINSAVIEILTFLCSVLFLVTADGAILEHQSAKNQNWLHANSHCDIKLVQFL